MKYILTDEAFKVYLDPQEKCIYLIKFLLEAFKENIFSWYILLHMQELKRTIHQLPTRDYNTIILKLHNGGIHP